jgi:hypothetical protein
MNEVARAARGVLGVNHTQQRHGASQFLRSKSEKLNLDKSKDITGLKRGGGARRAVNIPLTDHKKAKEKNQD